ncbi:3-oxoacyl-(acyl-carrier-protein) reductase [Sphingobium chlorophenolicum L-1]|uniref:3-oxoacyl-(Acyl-carrier-protein) reductase n=1 Tax=Sphingobium chlorophenolicum L-1 TaxID=690566 RepID=F6F388_SPHCR|nr:SDR family oxidoreductase [Sphingobium chlorophenolicum]AEG50900.1 3-oxoacyl-(acyl-carrier-protein) reductase [Sphingobium chlorophenolicum L-1]
MKSALIIGGASGVGAATARAFAAEGVRVAVADLAVEPAQALVDELGPDHRAYRCDITSETDILSLFDKVEQDLGDLTILVTAAGTAGFLNGTMPRLQDVPSDHWDQVMNINLRGGFLALREMLRRRMAKPVPHARIVTISSMAPQKIPSVAGAAYVVSKGALLTLTKVAAGEAAPFGMTVNTVAPGAIDTPMLRERTPVEQFEQLFGPTLAGRPARPDEIASAVLYLASEQAAFVNGACLDINGGMLMR